SEVARGMPPYGDFMRDLAFGARVGNWFFCHSGNTLGRSLDSLGASIRAEVDRENFSAPVLLGPQSVLESELWRQSADPAALVAANLAALGASHVVFGHDPAAFSRKGAISQQLSGRMFLIDVGMSPAVNDSLGALLRLDWVGG